MRTSSTEKRLRSRSRPSDTTAGTWALGIIYALNARGIDGAALARQAGIDPEGLDQAGCRTPVAANSRLWRLAVEATGDPALGLSVPPYMLRLGKSPLMMAGLASATLRDAIERGARYMRIFSTAATWHVTEVDDCLRCEIVTDFAETPPCAEAIDGMASAILRTCRFLHTEVAVVPLAVRLRRPEPPCADVYHEHFGVVVAFSQPRNEIDLSRELVERPLPGANAELARTLDEAARAHLAGFDVEATTYRIRAAIIDRLSSGETAQPDVAQQVGLTVRAMQRRLREEGTSFSALVDDIRHELAESYLNEGGRTASEIAYLLGFADVSAFSRAFKRWTGKPPSVFAGRRGDD